MKLEVAGAVLRSGMAEGTFTGKKLADYLPGDYVGRPQDHQRNRQGRRDRALCREFEASLKEAGR